MKDKLSIYWGIFLTILLVFIISVEVMHRVSKEKDLTYQCRIVIDKHLAVEDYSSEEEPKADKGNMYESTSYGVLPKNQKDYMKIFKAYSAKCNYSGPYVKAAVVLKEATPAQVQKVVEDLDGAKISFIIPYYVPNLHEVIDSIIANGDEFFIQLPTQSSIPEEKTSKVSPFLANADPKETLDKLRYLIASSKYAIGVSVISNSLLLKSKKDLLLIANELSKKGLAFLGLQDGGDVFEDVLQDIKMLLLRAEVYSEEDEISASSSFIFDFSQMQKFMSSLPKGAKIVPLSFGVQDASL